MRAHQLAGIRLRRRVRTTIPEPADEKFGDLLQRDFTAKSRTSVTSVTSPTFRWPVAGASIWPP